MDIFVAIIMGLVQGLTEFLPVSSSGHLMVAQNWFGVAESSLLFVLILHLATLCAVVIVFRKKIWELIKNPFCKTGYALLISTVISCALVLIFMDYIDSAFNYNFLPFFFLVTATLLLVVTFINVKPNQQADGTTVTYKTSIATGIMQGIAVIPGISRSGATIAAALATGANREDAAEFSFLMSIPIIIASFVYHVVSNPSGIMSIDILPIILGFIAAFVSGIFAIKIMLALVKRVKLYWFSAYLVVLAVVLLIIQMI